MTGVNKSGVRLSSSHHNILYHQNKTVMILSFKIRYSLKFCLSPYIVDSKQVFDIGDNLSDKLKQQRLFSNSRTCFLMLNKIKIKFKVEIHRLGKIEKKDEVFKFSE